MSGKRIALWTLAPVAAAWIWSATASGIYLASIGFLSEFKAPWLQWWIALHYAIKDGWTGWTTIYVWFWLIASGAVPSLLLGACAVLWSRKRKSGMELYGKSSWATQRDMAPSSIRTDRSAF